VQTRRIDIIVSCTRSFAGRHEHGVARFAFYPRVRRWVGGLLFEDHIIFIAEHGGDIPLSVHAMGARLSSLRSSLVIRIRSSSTVFSSATLVIGFRLENEKALADLSKRIGWLSAGEREIMIHIVRGRLSKEIAGHIGIAGGTVKIHLIEAMRKMNAQSLPELGRMADRLKLVSAKLQTS
jgi:DNA-binding CsgD family transcriptional regulator